MLKTKIEEQLKADLGDILAPSLLENIAERAASACGVALFGESFIVDAPPEVAAEPKEPPKRRGRPRKKKTETPVEPELTVAAPPSEQPVLTTLPPMEPVAPPEPGVASTASLL